MNLANVCGLTCTPSIPKMMKNVQQMRTMLPIGRSDDSNVWTTSFKPGARLMTLEIENQITPCRCLWKLRKVLKIWCCLDFDHELATPLLRSCRYHLRTSDINKKGQLRCSVITCLHFFFTAYFSSNSSLLSSLSLPLSLSFSLSPTNVLTQTWWNPADEIWLFFIITSQPSLYSAHKPQRPAFIFIIVSLRIVIDRSHWYRTARLKGIKKQSQLFRCKTIFRIVGSSRNV